MLIKQTDEFTSEFLLNLLNVKNNVQICGNACLTLFFKLSKNTKLIMGTNSKKAQMVNQYWWQILTEMRMFVLFVSAELFSHFGRFHCLNFPLYSTSLLLVTLRHTPCSFPLRPPPPPLNLNANFLPFQTLIPNPLSSALRFVLF